MVGVPLHVCHRQLQPVEQVPIFVLGPVIVLPEKIVDLLQALTAFDTTSCQTGTPQPNSASAAGAIAVDAAGESTALGDSVETKQSVPVDQTFHITVHMTANPDPNTVGYQLRLHWDEALLDLTTRTAEENNLWLQNFTGGSAIQVLGPTDDDTGVRRARGGLLWVANVSWLVLEQATQEARWLRS